MKKLSMLLASVVLTMGLLGGVAAATQQEDNTCSITGTGANSVNSCTFNSDHFVTIHCTNGVNIDNVNKQNADGGEVEANGNTIVGNAKSGDSENINETATKLAESCLAAAPVVTPTTTTPTTPAQPQVLAATTTPVKALPKTGASSTVTNAAVAVAGILTVAAVTQLGVASYRRSHN